MIHTHTPGIGNLRNSCEPPSRNCTVTIRESRGTKRAMAFINLNEQNAGFEDDSNSLMRPDKSTNFGAECQLTTTTPFPVIGTRKGGVSSLEENWDRSACGAGPRIYFGTAAGSDFVNLISPS